MGEIADSMIEGIACSWCGVCFEEEHGYPVLCSGCYDGGAAGIAKATHKEL